MIINCMLLVFFIELRDSDYITAAIPAEEKNPCILTVSGAFKIFFS
jgi:hypothetical protein